jgi:uncharacterized protein (TIGR03437 family)
VPTAFTPQIILNGAFIASSAIEYSGLAPYEAGVWQINFQIPTNVSPGANIPVEVILDSVPSNNPAAPGQIATTISIK